MHVPNLLQALANEHGLRAAVEVGSATIPSRNARPAGSRYPTRQAQKGKSEQANCAAPLIPLIEEHYTYGRAPPCVSGSGRLLVLQTGPRRETLQQQTSPDFNKMHF